MAVQYEGAIQITEKMKEKKFSVLCMDWIGAMCLYTLPLLVWPYLSEIADTGPEQCPNTMYYNTVQCAV